jgi:hypothetical protein
MFTLIALGAMSSTVAAKGTSGRSETASFENVAVQSCDGFAITSSYTVTRAYRIVEDYAHHVVVEHRQVSFSGALANSTNGKSYVYDGHFTLNANYDEGFFQISDLLLRFEVGTLGEFSLSLARTDFDLIDNPPAVVQAIVPDVLHKDLCDLFGGPMIGAKPSNISSYQILPRLATNQSILASVPPEYRERVHLQAKDQPAATDDSPNWSELDPCDTTPPGKPC